MGNRDQTSRLVIVVAALLFGTALIIWRLAWIQFGLYEDYSQKADDYISGWVSEVPTRGYIYDSSGNVVLAAPGSDYELGLDIPLTFERLDDGSTEWVEIDKILYGVLEVLGVPYATLKERIVEGQPYAHLSNRITPQEAEEIKALGFPGLAYQPIPTRLYPQKNLLCHALGYVDSDGTGGMGLEGNYQRELTGNAVAEAVVNLPNEPLSFASATPSYDLVLTIDRNVQATVERHLQQAIATYGAESGTIIAMNPKTGAILAMASTPCFDPKEYGSVDDVSILANPATSRLYEPGSVMKLITVAAAIDSGAVGAESIYADSGLRITGGIPIRNADSAAYGPINMAQTLEYSVNTATAWAAETMGADTFYAYMDRFGFGRATEVDLAHEVRGIVARPGMDNWSPASLATNAFGQGFATTPLQMLTSIAAIANEGKMMRPYLVQEMRSEDQVIVTQPQHQLTISAETARLINSWAIKSGHYAELEGYTIAGKTGTAQIAINQGDGVGFYHPDDVIASFVGWLPADDPQLAMIVKLDKITTVEWGSESAAPAFAELAKDLVILLDIPPDSVRLANTSP